jgi:ThiF family
VTEAQPKLTPELRAGRRALEGVEGFRLLRDWEWNGNVGRWVLHCRLSFPLPMDAPIPAATNWHVLAECAYPWGTIKVHPAREGGITKTFPHQSYNAISHQALPWRDGDICLDSSVHVLGRHGFDPEPYDAELRLHWRITRALLWLQAASRHELALPGEPFELPAFPTISGAGFEVAFQENTASFDRWNEVSDRSGSCEFIETPFKQWVVTLLRTPTRRFSLPLSWGTIVRQHASAKRIGAWIKLDRTPALFPWQAPATWGELRAVVREQGLVLDDLINAISPGLRDGRRHVLLIGFPIPEHVEGPSRRMHWVGVWLPTLSSGSLTARGFRPSEEGYRRRDRREILNDEAPIEWLSSSNWDEADILSRGCLPDSLRTRRVCLLGAGALGSHIAELLVRGGVRQVVVVDQDRLQVGNLVRHTLLLPNIAQSKAEALVERLNAISPHAMVSAISATFPHLSASQLAVLRSCDLILDCTADDAVLFHLGENSYTTENCLFVSMSLGYQAQRLFCFSAYGPTLPLSAFREQISPWLLREREEKTDAPFPREGLGCWHPIFPAREDNIAMMATFALQHLLSVAGQVEHNASLAVYEQEQANGVCVGIRKIVCEAAGA